ncbi:phosphatase PAP2 family protein [Cyberlindnera jadinii NRRL Y-1542]|uniref:PAP2-domain-containing protein n=1 Tax=Cyberlindnera jadinii (strain ATCC 18201 / CBS 1600 / BCRC 20928 / JCM 3617 / NBRC 0987 / NRRL Y-1542) TaxID=983966 RepID=A0A1E4SA33_CYBJN|nr:PAP2-domain-containing protein [Cyberlindnera jadinii NRRL Y-1542]ODV76369.1 PAP2-domain-containing protein [Cyberlindnera jadinii NRRL Y-1542]
MAVDRITLGLDNFSVYPVFVKWRIGDVILIPIVFLINSYVFYISYPFERQFVINDVTINHPFTEHERVPNEVNMIYSLAIPVVIIVIVTSLLGDPRHKLYLGYISILGLFVSFFVNELFTDALKNWIGRHRPDFIARCIPKADAPRDVLVFAKDVCTTKDLLRLADGFRTTPSGHSSSAFSGLGYLSLWLMGQLLTEHPLTGSWRKVVAAVPLLGAALIAISRTEDYRHHFVDVILGSMLGFTVAYWSYRRNFPELSSNASFKPYLDDSDVKAVENAIIRADTGEDYNSHLLSNNNV